MSVFTDIGNLWKLIGLIKALKETKMDIKTTAGILKIVSYVAALAAMVFGYMNPQTVFSIVLVVSAVIKLVEVIVSLTPSTEDDVIVQKIKEELLKNNLIKPE